MKTLTIDPGLLVQAPTSAQHKNYGRDCFLAQSPELEVVLEQYYGRSGLCIKLFKGSAGKDPMTQIWGGVSLYDATRTQNIFAMYGIAPRVYDIVTLNGGPLAQVCDYATGKGTPDVELAQKLVRKYKIGAAGYKQRRLKALEYVALDFKWVGGWFVDFGRFHCTNPSWYEARLRQKIQHRKRGKKGKLVGYQALPALGVPGQRDLRHRIKHMQLDGLDFNGKTVLDIGCNLGDFCRDAIDRGAKRVVGIDYKYAQLCREVDNWLGYWNIDVLDLELPKLYTHIQVLTGIERFDIVYALAIVQHMKGEYQPWLAKLTKEVFYLEGDRLPPGTKFKSDAKYSAALKHDFREVEWLGWIKDEDHRALYRCWQIPRPEWGELPTQAAELKTEAIRRGQSIYGRVLMSREELDFLYDLAAIAPDGPACEVGCFDGSSLVCWATARVGRGPMKAIDIVGSWGMEKNIRHSGYPIETVIGKSWEVGAKLEPQAFAFIDADHTVTGIPRDIKAYPPNIMPGGIIAFHDYDKKESQRGKGYVVKATVEAWQKKARWIPLGQAGRVIAFRRPYSD